MIVGVGQTLVVTSVNPFSNVPHQRKCFLQWQALGYDVVTANVKVEADKLLELGFKQADILVTPEAETGLALFQKPVPLVVPLLQRMENDFGHEYCILVNADIYAAVRSSTLSSFWDSCNSVLALTRDETHALAAHDYFQNTPYRGGLDAFFMTQGALKRVNRQLQGLSCSDRMAFGIPGWDYLLGAVVLSPNVGGTIVDSGLLLHRSHKATYGNISEFNHYVPDMVSLGAVNAHEASQAAHEFSQCIKSHCDINSVLTRRAKALFYTPVQKNYAELASDGAISSIFEQISNQFPDMANSYRHYTLLSLLQRGLEDNNLSFSMFVNTLATSPSKLYQFSQVLFAACVFQTVQRQTMRLAQISSRYPEGSQHAPALRNVLSSYEDGTPERRLHIATLFFSELLEFSIFNPRLYKYLALSCCNESERDLLKTTAVSCHGEVQNVA